MSRKLRHRSHHGLHEAVREETHEQEVESLAYRYWEERGSPIGTPDEDWFKAEAHLEKEQEAASKL